MSVIEAIAWGAGLGIVSVLLAGVRRLPWLYASLVGVGTGVVFAALRLATRDASFDPGLLVLVGAFGGSLATLGAERGERARIRRSEAMLAGRPPSLG